ncbi:MAG: hypothetical protein ABIO46_03880 [Chitinophagales bacterium]
MIDISGRIRASVSFEEPTGQHAAVKLYTGNIPEGIYLVTLKTTSQF